jgi:hypothetical protein
MSDQPDFLNDHLARSRQFDPWERHEELASSSVTIPAAPGGPIRVVVTDEESFSRPSAVVT